MVLKVLTVLAFLLYSFLLPCSLLTEKRFRFRYIYFFVAGIISFAAVLFLQIPIQNLMKNSAELNNLNIVYTAILYAAVAGFVQEFFKALVALRPQGNLLSGAFAGAGFGLAEAIFIVSLSPLVSLISIIERAFAIIFHVSSTAIVLHGKTINRFWLSYTVMALIHTLVDFVAAFYTLTAHIPIIFAESFAALIATLLFVVTLVFKKQEERKISTKQTL